MRHRALHALLVLATAVSGCTTDFSRGRDAGADAGAAEPDVGGGVADAGAGALDADEMEIEPPPADAPEPDAGPLPEPMEGRPCTHSFGGVYDHLGCSPAYQCFDGAWRTRAPGAMCVCEESTGRIGCREDGMPPPTGVDAGVVSMPPVRSSSESIGTVTSGRQRNAVRIVAAPSFVVADTGRDAYWGTEETVYWLRTGFERVAAELPGSARPQIRDISIEAGGVPAGDWPHSSHRSGRDADGTYYLHACSSGGCPLSDVPLADFDAEATWTLFEHWIRAGVITYIFVDHALQQPLYEEAVRRGASPAELSRWFQYPRPATERVGLIRHVANHRNHFHVRFVCPDDDLECIE